MQSAGSCRVAEITHALRFTQHLRPRHFVQMILERHWMGNKLQAFIQAAVRLDVQIFGILVCNIKQLLRVAVDRAAVIDFELHAEMTQAFAVEYKVGRIAVFMDDLAVLIPAGHAVGVVVTVPICAVAVNNAAAIIAAHVILIEAVITERVRVILDSIFLINPFVAVVTDDSQSVSAILAEPVALYLKHIFDCMLRTTVCTNSCFTHWLVLHFI